MPHFTQNPIYGTGAGPSSAPLYGAVQIEPEGQRRPSTGLRPPSPRDNWSIHTCIRDSSFPPCEGGGGGGGGVVAAERWPDTRVPSCLASWNCRLCRACSLCPLSTPPNPKRTTPPFLTSDKGRRVSQGGERARSHCHSIAPPKTRVSKPSREHVQPCRSDHPRNVPLRSRWSHRQ